MPTIATNLQKSFCRSPSTTLQKQQDRIFANNSEQKLHRQKSVIRSVEEVQEEHVLEKEIKAKQLIKGRTVAATTTTEVKLEQHLKGKAQSQGSPEKAQKVYDQVIGAFRDYQIYQNGSVNEFFSKTTLKSDHIVADICLVNDYFILVKMPQENVSICNLTAAAACTKPLRALKDRARNQKKNRKLCCCWRNKRNRITKIAPIHEEAEDLSAAEPENTAKSSCLKLTACWQANEQEMEMYQTKTKIDKNFPNTPDNRSKTIKQSNSTSQKFTEGTTQRLDVKQASDISTISGTLLPSSLQCNVDLQSYGSLVDRPNNKGQLEMLDRSRHRKCSRLECFYWLLKPFRRKARKTEPKIQAIVYKTYFVKWSKPPDIVAHGYGTKSMRTASAGMSVLRRCRSALF